MNNKYLKNKRILITGISGFIGKSLNSRLSSFGVEVFGISRASGDGKKILNADIQNFELVNNFIKRNKINICFHLASEALVESGQDHPFQTFKTNTNGTLNILESGRVNKLEKIIIASSAHVYGKNRIPYKEDYMPFPTRPYETSKACTDLIAQSYAKSFDIPILIPRFVNIYGGGDLNFQRLIPKTIKHVLKNSHPKMWGGKIMRDYLFIDDAIDAYILLASLNVKRNYENQIFNFGSGNIISVEKLVKKIISISGKKLMVKKIKNGRSGEIPLQYVSSIKAKKILGWSPKVNLEEGLKKTIDWYSEFLYTRE